MKDKDFPVLTVKPPCTFYFICKEGDDYTVYQKCDKGLKDDPNRCGLGKYKAGMPC